MGIGILSIFVVFSLEFVIGNVVDGFIALVNCVDLVKRRKISKVDQMLIALAISRICLLWSVVVNILFSFAYAGRLSIQLLRISNMFWVVANHFNLWLSTNLGLFYFLKIAHFSSSIFLYLKWRVRKVVSMTLLMSLVPLCSHVFAINTLLSVWTGACTRNMSYFYCAMNSTWFSRHLLLINSVFGLMPLAFSLAVFFLLILSLWKHQMQMQRAVWRARDASTTAHVKALQTGVAFLLLYIAFMLSLVMQLWFFDFVDKHLLVFLCLVTGITFPLGHSVVLVLGNSKLRRASGIMLWVLGRRCRGVESPRP
ncbi:taste receptor type 2 member 125-like [Perognathus longimembris pacificus]|uniref:taste receptor type 2 member 125-like n=1 Tax=Perognathus longimembris pacificus TaxID=214514 RepID=UPI002019E802|nr:taste receptor type 2 member 125-like [Perognathus longimembris pacificus]